MNEKEPRGPDKPDGWTDEDWKRGWRKTGAGLDFRPIDAASGPPGESWEEQEARERGVKAEFARRPWQERLIDIARRMFRRDNGEEPTKHHIEE